MSTKKIQILNSVVSTDTTLTQSDVAADAKAVGDLIDAIQNVLSIDYENLLAFDTTEIICSTSASAVLGQAILGQLILA